MHRKFLFPVIVLIFCTPVWADLLVLQTGKTIRIWSYSIEGSSMDVQINDRGEMVIPLEWVREIRATPSEPDPEDTAASPEPQFAYSDLILPLARKHAMDWKLIAAVMAAESNFDPYAISPKGALGLMQLMPDTARIYRVHDPYDPHQNIDAGIRHLKWLIDRYHGKLELALAAYNAGEKVVDRYRAIPPYEETREYVKRVLRFYRGLSALT